MKVSKVNHTKAAVGKNLHGIGDEGEEQKA